MAIDLADYETKIREAIQAFWGNREKAMQKQLEAGTGAAAYNRFRHRLAAIRSGNRRLC